MSYSPVFSQGFIYYTEAAPNNSFGVPEGFTAVLRDVQISCEAGGSLFAIYGDNGAGAPVYTILYLEVLGATQSASWEGRVVIPGGGALSLAQTTLGVGASAYVGGYLLRNTIS